MTTASAKRNPGRPREFDEDKALDAALLMFWEKGYDATSLSDLTEAMGISRPSMYSTLGNKEKLFKLALERYSLRNAKLFDECLSLPTAKEGIETLLREAVKIFADSKNPGGCMGIQSVVTCSTVSGTLKKEMDRKRVEFESKLKKRFDRAVSAGELPKSTVTLDLARYYSVVFQGLSLQAKAGASIRELIGVVDVAMAGWPAKS